MRMKGLHVNSFHSWAFQHHTQAFPAVISLQLLPALTHASRQTQEWELSKNPSPGWGARRLRSDFRETKRNPKPPLFRNASWHGEQEEKVKSPAKPRAPKAWVGTGFWGGSAGPSQYFWGSRAGLCLAVSCLAHPLVSGSPGSYAFWLSSPRLAFSEGQAWSSPL